MLLLYCFNICCFHLIVRKRVTTTLTFNPSIPDKESVSKVICESLQITNLLYKNMSSEKNGKMAKKLLAYYSFVTFLLVISQLISVIIIKLTCN